MFRELANKRASIRAFKEKDVDEGMVNEILKDAILAPSAGNLQAWELVVVRDSKTKERLVDASYGQDFITRASVVVVVCANRKRSASKYGVRGHEFYSIADACIIATYIQLAVADRDLGSVWVGAFDNEEVKAILNLPPYVEPVAIIPIGYPAEKGHKKERFPLERVVHKEKYSQA